MSLIALTAGTATAPSLGFVNASKDTGFFFVADASDANDDYIGVTVTSNDNALVTSETRIGQQYLKFPVLTGAPNPAPAAGDLGAIYCDGGDSNNFKFWTGAGYETVAFVP